MNNRDPSGMVRAYASKRLSCRHNRYADETERQKAWRFKAKLSILWAAELTLRLRANFLGSHAELSRGNSN